MNLQNINIGADVEIHETASINNVCFGEGVKIAKRCSIFGGPDNLLLIGLKSYIGMNSILNGFAARLEIGHHCSFAQNINVMTDSGPNASYLLQKIFPIKKGPVKIGNHCWIGANSVVMPNVTLGDFCIVGANSFVTKSFEDYCVLGGTPAELIRKLTNEEVNELRSGE